MPRAPRSTPPAWLAALAVTLAGAGCEEERVVYYRPMFSGLPGVESGTPITDSKPRGAIDAPPPSEAEQLVAVAPDTKKTTLTARTARHVMIHVYTTLKDNDEALFLDQVLSKKTKDEYLERGLEPGEAFAFLRAHFDDIKKLFDAMPMGEYTPGLYVEAVGPNIQRLEVHGKAAQGLVWTGFDMVREGADYRLRWFTGPGPAPERARDPDAEAPRVVTGPKRE